MNLHAAPRFSRTLRRRALWVTLAVVGVATAGMTWFVVTHRDRSAATSATVRVARGTVAATVSAAGSVASVTTRGLSFSVAGTVTELEVKAGDQVAAGQVLARIDQTDAGAAVDAAQTSLTTAQDALTRALATPAPAAAAVTPTCRAAGAVTAVAYRLPPSPSPSPSPSLSASASPSASGSTSSPAGPPAPSGRGSPPAPGGGASARSSAGCATASGARSATGSGGGGSTAGRGGAADAQFAAEQQVNNATLALSLAQGRLAGTTITASAAGTVLTVGGRVGAAESPGGTGFIVLGGINEREVRAEFSEADVSRLRIGQPATITLTTSAGAELTGRVARIDPAGTAAGRLVRYGVLIAFDQVPDRLLIGQSAAVSVVTDTVDGALYAPVTAVAVDDSGAATVVVRTAGRSVRRTVGVGLRGDRFTVLTSGVAEGDELVPGGGG